ARARDESIRTGPRAHCQVPAESSSSHFFHFPQATSAALLFLHLGLQSLRAPAPASRFLAKHFLSSPALPHPHSSFSFRRRRMAIDHASPLALKSGGAATGGAGRDEEAGNQRWPPWLKPLLATSFFVQCRAHADAHKSECNMYCLDCINGALCSLCLAHHRDHHAIQIRRSSYHDVIRVSEIQRVLDITGVQTYIINSARVVFLNERPQPRPGKGVTNTCEVCERSLLDSFRFCSLGCKIVGTSGGHRPRKKHGGVGGGGKKKRAAVKDARSDSEHSCTSTSGGSSDRSSVVQSFSPSTPPATSSSYRAGNKRRKGIPHRSPFGSLIVEY
uniref:B box-type domain-containing protein n=3 Tax=Triticinae TaxID=1648030 RepID=A0A453PB20_AEGTS